MVIVWPRDVNTVKMSGEGCPVRENRRRRDMDLAGVQRVGENVVGDAADKEPTEAMYSVVKDRDFRTSRLRIEYGLGYSEAS